MKMWYTIKVMKKIRIFLAVLACKTSRWLLRLLGGGGTDFPGRVALALCPNLLGELAKNVTTILVTGTNGKTTTSRMIEQTLADSEISYFANKSGANLLSGVTAEFCAFSTLGGKCKKSVALIEADEAAFKAISRFVDAKTIVVTNVFRDQLDRYGEVTHTLGNLRIGLENSPNATVCLNADDSLCASLADTAKNVVFYGVNVPIYASRVAELSDAPYCLRCKHEYEYEYITYGHLGKWQCPSCGYARPDPQAAVTSIAVSNADRSEITVTVDGTPFDLTVNLPGGYNIYNACASMAAAKASGLDLSVAAAALGHFSCGFGRMEKFRVGKTYARMILIKNPAGCNQVLNFLTQRRDPFVFAACLNDRAQDGKDVSWIWDVDIERLAQMGDTLQRVCVTGIRAADMALRFYYAGIPAEKIEVCDTYDALLDKFAEQTAPIYVMPTYTAMLSLRKICSKKFGLKAFWE